MIEDYRIFCCLFQEEKGDLKRIQIDGCRYNDRLNAKRRDLNASQQIQTSKGCG